MIENTPRMIHAQEGDNLYSIALKYNTSPSYLQVINNIYPPLITKGTDILLGSVEDVANAHHSFYVVFTSNNIEYPGTITVLPDSFVFEQRQMSLTSPKLVYPINIVSIVQSSLFPHPSINSRSYNDPAQPAILIICFLADPFNQKNVEVATFEGPRAELDALYILIQSRAKNRQSKIKFNITEHAQHAAELKTIDSLEEHNKPAYLRSKAVIRAQQVIFGESKILDMVDIFSIRRELPYRFRALAWTKIFGVKNFLTGFSSINPSSLYTQPIKNLIWESKANFLLST
ncbi:LysM domain containing protein [Trichomonas vaginalis G3]|uniref:LysM domain containing protein n=1 Tax=Trichomonas vaginalis (strain ATCC PRA-98 / G3) TaxID=412133 RepID=A2EYA8_TRIV3|nr:spectrin binding [Trichomonas vaginalis G3]EAY02335.1 LysM domain containing protein [Trichomonas vaginalis G3]KAI5514061.1 spectrin binding [Trichomonas vaginalis G3]|eukprot:XP_001314650.1 LysM domain containing protein [Trichomonas vaginalis G3]